MEAAGITHHEVHRALGRVNVRVSLRLRGRARCYWYLTPPLILINPARHESEDDLADSLLHEVIHHLRPGWREAGRIRAVASDLRSSPYLDRRLLRRVTRAMMIFLGGGAKNGVVAGT